MELQTRDGSSDTVAVKKLKPGVIEDDDDLKELVEESNLLRRVRHRGIVDFKGIGCFDETSVETMRSSIFLAEEFMAGGSLKHLIMDQMRSETKRLYWMHDAWKWLLQIAEALAYLHGCSPSVVHRDVKPENVLMSSKDWSTSIAKIADFGLHKRINRVHQIKRNKSSHLLEPVLDIPEPPSESEIEHRSENKAIDIPKASTRPPPLPSFETSSFDLDIPGHFRIIKKSASLRSGPTISINEFLSSSVQRDSPLWMVPEDSPLTDSDIGYHHLTSAYSVPQALISEDFSPIHLVTPKQPSIKSSSLIHADDNDHELSASSSEGDDTSASLETRMASDERVRGGQVGQLMGWIQTNSEKITSSQSVVPVALEAPIPSPVDSFSLHFLFQPEAKIKTKMQNTNLGDDASERKQHGSHHALDQLNLKAPSKLDQKPKESKKQKSVRFSNRYSLGLSGTENISGVVGSLMYMAPEVYKGKQYNEKVDVFGFGLVMYELLMSELVIVRVLMQANRPSEMQSMLKRHAKSVAKGHREDMPYHWPEAVQKLIKSCWHQRPERRPKMAEVVEQLNLLNQMGCIAEMDRRLERRYKRDPRCCPYCIIA